ASNLPVSNLAVSNLSAVSGTATENSLVPQFATTESSAPAVRAPERTVTADDLDPQIVKESFAPIMSAGPAAMEYFYARLFAVSPDARALSRRRMTAQRERVSAALARLVWSLDNQPECAQLLRQLGRDHRRFGVTDRHYEAFIATLRDTAEHFIG